MGTSVIADPAAEAAAAAALAATAAATAAAEKAAADTAAAEKAIADKAAADAAAAAASAGAVPDTYTLKLPDGSKADPAIVERTAADARALGLGNEAGQKLLDLRVRDLADRETANTAIIEAWQPGGAEFVKRDDAWRKEALADPDIGGTPEKLGVSIEKAKQALEKYGSPELATVLNETGYGSHPQLLKMLANIGRAMSEGSLVHGAGGPSSKPKSDAQAMYPEHYTPEGAPKP